MAQDVRLQVLSISNSIASGANFSITVTEGTVFPVTCTKAELQQGLDITVSSNTVNQVTVTAMDGPCSGSATDSPTWEVIAPTATPTPTVSPTPTISPTPTETTPPSTDTPTPTPTETTAPATDTPTPTPTSTNTPTPTPTPTETTAPATDTPTPTPTSTALPTYYRFENCDTGQLVFQSSVAPNIQTNDRYSNGVTNFIYDGSTPTTQPGTVVTNLTYIGGTGCIDPTVTPTSVPEYFYFMRPCGQNVDRVVRTETSLFIGAGENDSATISIFGTCYYPYSTANSIDFNNNAGDLASYDAGAVSFSVGCSQCQGPSDTPTPTPTQPPATDTPTPTPTSAPSTATPTPTSAPSIYYARFVECSDPAGQVLEVSSSSPISFQVLSHLGNCYQYQGTGGQGVNGDISGFTSYIDCNACTNPSTTSTPTPTPTSGGSGGGGTTPIPTDPSYVDTRNPDGGTQ